MDSLKKRGSGDRGSANQRGRGRPGEGGGPGGGSGSRQPEEAGERVEHWTCVSRGGESRGSGATSPGDEWRPVGLVVLIQSPCIFKLRGEFHSFTLTDVNGCKYCV